MRFLLVASAFALASFGLAHAQEASPTPSPSAMHDTMMKDKMHGKHDKMHGKHDKMHAGTMKGDAMHAEPSPSPTP